MSEAFLRYLMVCKTPSIALDSDEFIEARDAWLKESEEKKDE